MIRNFFLVAALSLFISFAGVFGTVFAQVEPSLERITSYGANIHVNLDNSIDVTETIVYNTGSQERHGIYRDIIPYSSQRTKMEIGGITVTDDHGSPYQFQISHVNKNIRIKIGDPNWTFVGEKIYVIKYHATKAIAQLKDIDELYWNVTGNEWTMPIYSGQASVTLPSGTTLVQSACYYGPSSSNSRCEPVGGSSGVSWGKGLYTFSAPAKLESQSGFTIAIGFPKGIVAPYSFSDTASDFFNTYWQWIVSALLPLFTFLFSYIYWYRNGRDPEGVGVIVPQYDVPDGLTPMEVAGIVNEKVSTKSISAEIIYLATLGYIKINQLEKKYLGLFSSIDYELIKIKDFSDLPNAFDKKLLNSLFDIESQVSLSDFYNLFSKQVTLPNIETTTSMSDSVKLSDLDTVFYRAADSVVSLVLDALLSKGYYKNLGSMKNGGSGVVVIFFMSIWLSCILGFLLFGIFGENPVPFVVGIFASIVVYGIVSYFSPAKTEKGVATEEYVLGLKDYLQIAEKNRLEFHNAPEKKPEVFEKLLPYAIVLGVVDIWAKEFEGIYTTPPSWYSGTPGAAFSAVAFSDTLTDFNSSATNALTSTPSSSGSGSSGGGSSGGGGGGGGGGSW